MHARDPAHPPLVSFAARQVVVAAIALGLWACSSRCSWRWAPAALILFFVVWIRDRRGSVFFIGVADRVHLRHRTTLASLLGADDTRMPLVIVVNRLDDGISNLLLLAVPMFVFAGLLMEMTGIARVDGELPSRRWFWTA